MSKPRYPWWGYMKTIIRRYPSEKSKESPGLSKQEKAAVEAAIAEAEIMPDGRDRIAFIRMVFWEQTHTLSGAALAIPCSERTARRWHTAFIKSVAKHLGLLE